MVSKIGNNIEHREGYTAYVADNPRDFFVETGLLWLINRVVFHPRGFALGLNFDEEGNIYNSELWVTDQVEPWGFTEEVDNEKYAMVESLLVHLALEGRKPAVELP